MATKQNDKEKGKQNNQNDAQNTAADNPDIDPVDASEVTDTTPTLPEDQNNRTSVRPGQDHAALDPGGTLRAPDSRPADER